MTISYQPENSIVLDVQTVVSDWCVYEHWAVIKEGEPPSCIMVGASKLSEVLKLTNARCNSEWAKMFQAGGTIMLRIIALGDDRREIFNEAIRQTRKYDPVPHCNLRGFSLAGAVKRIMCSDGRVFATQEEAAAGLGASQSMVSRHLRGEINNVKGFLLTYQGAD